MKTIVQLVQELHDYFIGKDTTAKQAVEANIAPVETDATSASKSYAIGEQLILNDVLYKAKTAITAGDALVVDTNIELAADVTTQIATIDMSNFVNKSVIDTDVETIGSAALYPHTNGTVFFASNGNLYKATTDIAASDTLTVGTNCALDSVVDSVNDLEGDVSSLSTNKVNTSDIANNLTTTTAGKVLDATQGKALDDAKEDVPTVLTSTLAAGATTLTFTDASIGNSSRIRAYSDPFVLGLITNMVQSGTSVTLTCAAQGSAVSVKLEVRN